MIMSCCSSTSSSSSHLHNTLFLNKGFSKALSSTHVTIPPPPKPHFTLPNWRSSSTGGKGPVGGGADQRTRELRLHDAFLYLEHMVSKGHAPDPAQSTQLLYDLCRCNKLRKAVRVMELTATATGRPPDGPALTHLVNQLCKRGNVGHAMQLVDKMESLYGFTPSTVTYNSLVRGLCIHGNLSQSLQLLERLMRRGLVPNVFTFSFLLEAAYKERGVDEAERLLEEIVAKGGRPNLVSYNVLLTGFCKEGRLDDAVRLFRSLPSKGFRPNVVSHNILLRSLCYDGRWADAEELLAEMGGSGCSPSVITYNILVGSLALHGRTAHALEVLDEMARNGFRPNAASYNPIIARYCKEGDVAAAKDCLDSMIHRHQVVPSDGTFNAVALLCENPPGLVHEAFDILQTLCNNQQDCSTHEFYRSVVSQLCKKGNTFAAFQLLPEMAQVGFTPDSYTYSSLIRGLCAEGMLDEALEVMRVMEDGVVGFGAGGTSSLPDVDNYNALVLGFCKAQRTDLALDVYARMVEKGLTPSETTYAILVEGIAHEDETRLAAEVLMELHRRNAVKKNTVERIAMQYDLEEFLD